MSVATLIEQLGYGVALPAAVAWGLAVTVGCLAPEEHARRLAAAGGFAAGYLVGYALLPEWAAWVPSRHWQWLPYLVLGGSVIGPVGWAAGVSRFERWGLSVIVAFAAAWLLVPEWASLEPARGVLIPCLAGYLLLCMGGSAWLAQSVSSRRQAGLICVSLLALSLTVALFVSVNYARVVGLAVGSSAGIALASWRNVGGTALAGSAAALSVAGVGSAFVAAIEPQRPLWGMLLFPAAPLVPMLVQWSRLRRIGYRTELMVHAVLVMMSLGAAALVVQYESTWGAGTGSPP